MLADVVQEMEPGLTVIGSHFLDDHNLGVRSNQQQSRCNDHSYDPDPGDDRLTTSLRVFKVHDIARRSRHNGLVEVGHHKSKCICVRQLCESRECFGKLTVTIANVDITSI